MKFLEENGFSGYAFDQRILTYVGGPTLATKLPPIVKGLLMDNPRLVLVGGAPGDLYFGDTPRDWDFLCDNEKARKRVVDYLHKEGIYTWKSASDRALTTVADDGTVIQLLRGNLLGRDPAIPALQWMKDAFPLSISKFALWYGDPWQNGVGWEFGHLKKWYLRVPAENVPRFTPGHENPVLPTCFKLDGLVNAGSGFNLAYLLKILNKTAMRGVEEKKYGGLLTYGMEPEDIDNLMSFYAARIEEAIPDEETRKKVMSILGLDVGGSRSKSS